MWKKLEIYGGKYSVSDDGRVRSDASGKELSQRLSNKGYKVVYICGDGKKHDVPVHRLVATVFCDNPQNFKCVNHKDEDKLNNHADNLEWCDVWYNNHYGTRQHRCDEGRSKPIVAMKDGKIVKRYPSTKIAAKELGVNPSSIFGALSNRIKDHHTCCGYEWKYENIPR